MKHWTEMPYTQRLRWRVRLLWLAIAAMLVYMVVMAELGGGDSERSPGLPIWSAIFCFSAGWSGWDAALPAPKSC